MEKQLDETKLPKWAQTEISSLRDQIDELQTLKKLHGVLSNKNRDWYTIAGPNPNVGEDHIRLWVLYPDQPHAVCSLGKDDLLFIGRTKKMKQEIIALEVRSQNGNRRAKKRREKI